MVSSVGLPLVTMRSCSILACILLVLWWNLQTSLCPRDHGLTGSQKAPCPHHPNNLCSTLVRALLAIWRYLQISWCHIAPLSPGGYPSPLCLQAVQAAAIAATSGNTGRDHYCRSKVCACSSLRQMPHAELIRRPPCCIMPCNHTCTRPTTIFCGT